MTGPFQRNPLTLPFAVTVVIVVAGVIIIVVIIVIVVIVIVCNIVEFIIDGSVTLERRLAGEEEEE